MESRVPLRVEPGDEGDCVALEHVFDDRTRLRTERRLREHASLVQARDLSHGQKIALADSEGVLEENH